MEENNLTQNKKPKKGRGWHGSPEEHAKAGKKGGEKVAEERGPDFFSDIGKKGGEASPGKFEKGSDRAREAGRKGGKSRKKPN